MTPIDPEQAPEIPAPVPAGPEIDPGGTPDEMPPFEPAQGDDGDSPAL